MKKNGTQRNIGADSIKCQMCNDTGFVLYKEIHNGIECDMARECQCGIINRKRIQGRLSFAQMPDKYNNLCMMDFDIKYYQGSDRKQAEDVKKVMTQYIGNYFNLDGMGLYMFSPTKGTGKTIAAAIVANELVKRNVDVRFTTSGAILEEIKKTYNGDTKEDVLDELKKVDVLVIDDFGTEKVTKWRNETFYNIIDYRYTSKRPTIFTSNCSIKELEDAEYDSRITSRMKEMCYIVPFPATSVRDKKANENQMQMQNWLGAGK